MEEHSYHVIPGWKFCSKCYGKVTHLNSSDTETTSNASYSSEASWEQNFSRQSAKVKLDEGLNVMGLSPIASTHAFPKHARVSEAKRKMTKAVRSLETSFTSVIGLPEPTPLQPPATPSVSPEDYHALQQTEKDYMTFLYNVKEKVQQGKDSQEKIQFLTCTPESWSVNKAATFFNVTNYLVEKAVNLRKEKGIFAQVPNFQPKTILSEDTKQAVIDFHNNDLYSRCMPGMKNFVSIKKNHHMQKRLLLCNLNELHNAFLKAHPNMKIIFSKFCSMRPKWCITSSSSGTYSVCVVIIKMLCF